MRSPARTNASPGMDAVSTDSLFLSDDGQKQGAGTGESRFGRGDIVDLSVAAVAGSRTVSRIVNSLPDDELANLTSHHGYVPQPAIAPPSRCRSSCDAMGLPTTGAPDHSRGTGPTSFQRLHQVGPASRRFVRSK